MTANEIRTPTRRSRRGLVIEGTATRLSAEPSTLPGGIDRPSPSVIVDLAERLSSRPYQSLLDDAMRLARRCRPLDSTLRVLSPSS